MMSETLRREIIKKEIETYRKFAVVLESLKTVIYTFDGKCINKKFTEALDNFLKYGKEKRSYCVSVGINTTSNGNVFDMSIRCYDDTVRGEADSSGYYNSYYISNRDFYMRVNAEEITTMTAANGKPRINAKAFSEKLDEKIQYLHNKAEELEKAFKQVESMRADMEQIKQLMDSFNGKYHERIKEVFGCSFELKNRNGIQFR